MSKMELEAEVEFFSRVVNIPLVSSAITYASGAYHNAKVELLSHFFYQSIIIN